MVRTKGTRSNRTFKGKPLRLCGQYREPGHTRVMCPLVTGVDITIVASNNDIDQEDTFSTDGYMQGDMQLSQSTQV